MYRYALILSVVALSVSSANSEPYPSTLTTEEQERHEFIDVQKGNFPSGRAPQTANTSRSAKQGTPIIVQSTNPMIGVLPPSVNDRPVLMTTP